MVADKNTSAVWVLRSNFKKGRALQTRIAIFTLAVLFATPAVSQKASWEQMPRMQLERQFAGPLKDTLIQRWRDPADGMICYIYLPISAQHSPPVEGFVQYGANTIGSLSCFAPSGATAPRSAAPQSSREITPTLPARKTP
jgi:hypothetical protein